MAEAKMGDTVKIHYTATTNNDKLIFNSEDLEPLTFTIGKEEILPAFEEALIGMNEGEKKIIEISSENAFGPHLEELVTTVPVSQLPKDLQLEIGQQLQVQQPDGSVIIVSVIDLKDNIVTFDANHPLAGKDLKFKIQLLEIL